MTEQKIPMTPAGYARLRAELKQIKEVDRPENVRDIETALGHGDLRENAEYHAAKERQAQLDGRMRYLEARIGMAQVIDPETVREDKVTFGATVTMLDVENDQKVVYRIVGEDESDADKGKISLGAPIARAMLGKRVGDEVLVKLPKGDREYEVVRVEYKAIS
ncbi:transcription elongation factor GreA [Nannocystis sp. SCPEA4]|uniref:transcription elongation factor GreA n=1 Tax=Nannocystis sp. SCPEA4 TaxID=2996787 RepID=UPI00226D7689|nr:transcription elongation factor GreA [Nannocystis sp. SCPEA4]MCY1063107.1 transcription elongation factor GreA [Nannocystis sp. SCPEA4]